MNPIVHIAILFFLTISIVYIQAGPIFSDSKSSSSESDEQKKCDKHEVYNSCGSACPPSCSDLFYPQVNKFCTLQCVAGCFCEENYYRDENGKCVEAKKCCQGENEEYNRCGTACPETCTFKPDICTKQCIRGCFCKSDYIRKDNSTNSPCIKRDKC